MDPAYRNRTIVSLTDDELIALGFMGENVAPEVKDIVDKVKASPNYLGYVTCFNVDLIRKRLDCHIPPAVSKEETLFSQLINDADAHTVVAPDLISKYEMKFWYNGISGNPPELLYRSDLETNPFPIPPPGTTFSQIPSKTVHGVFKTPLNDVWHIVAPKIVASMKANGLKYSVLTTARFLISEDGKDETLGPVVVWIAVQPNTTNARAVRDATPDILHILADAHITDVVVEWYEGKTARLVDVPP
ncbi:hypothetical protein C8Q75DRAFT_725172 [Abortiporus biennis]|nr:hypothetical protein C8Q75DRAFT_725172 [Abortiporus biennis]